VPIDRPPSTLRRLGAAAAMGLTVATALLAATGVAAAAPPPSSSQVSNSDLAPACPGPSPTGFCTELVGGGAATVVDDQRPGGGRGYLRLTTRGPADRATVFAQRFAGMRLADITDLAYDTFVERTAVGNDQAAPAISIPIRSSRVRAPGGFTTLVWEPRNSGVRVAPFQWQRWTPSTSGGWSANGMGVLNRFGFGRYTAEGVMKEKGYDDHAIAHAREVADAAGQVMASHFASGYEQLADVKERFAKEPWLHSIEGEFTGQLLAEDEADLRRTGAPRYDNLNILWRYDAVAAIRAPDIPQLWVLAGDDREAPNAITRQRLMDLKHQGKRIDLYVFPHTDHGMYEFVQDADGTRHVTRITDGYFRLLADWIRRQDHPPYGAGQRAQ